MMMPTGAMHVTMLNFICGGVAHFGHFHVEVKFDTRQRMVGIYRDGLEAGFSNRYYLALSCLKLHALFDLLISKCRAWYFLYQPVVLCSVSFFR